MMNSKTLFTQSQIEAIEGIVGDAEKETSAEFVCAVATESGRYDRAESIGGMITSLIFLGLANAFYLNSDGSWEIHSVPLIVQGLAVSVGFVLGSILFSYVPGLRRLLTSEKEMKAEVERAASTVFAIEGLRRTEGRGGILIYLSLYERRVSVLADDGVIEVAGSEFSERLCQTTLEAIKRREFLQAFESAVAEAVAELKDSLPPSNRNNELPNRLIRIHPRP